MAGSRFEKLLEPGKIGQVKTRNRIIKTGAAMMYWHDDELHIPDTMKAYYEGLARGGAGLLIVEAPTVDYPMGCRWKERYRFDDDKYIQGMSELVRVIKEHNCPTFMQMNHDGPWRMKVFFDRPPISAGPPIAASALKLDLASDFHTEMTREMTIPEIKDVVNKFACAAERAQKAGFDGVDINAASSHLLHVFMSPFWNKRQDIYGGSVVNRARIVTEIVQEIKKRAGQGFGISICINGIEVGQAVGIKNSDCLTGEDSLKIAKLIQDAGADAIHIRSHWLGYHLGGFLPEQLFYPEPPIPLEAFPKEYYRQQRGAGANLNLATELKKSLSIPIMVVGRLDPVMGEKALRDGKADFICFNRRLMADPELPNKLAGGRADEIAPCTACCTCADTDRIERRCRINAFIGTNRPYIVQPAEKRKKVMVIGGGPAGMEAARVAALRGHEVVLYEKSTKLGGLMPLAALVKGMEIEDLPAIVRYLEGQIYKLGVKVRLGKEANTKTVKEIKPDVLILATGGIPAAPKITGIDKRNVIPSTELHRKLKFYLKYMGPRTLRSLTRFWMPIGNKVVIIGGGIQGCELAEFLIKRGRKVTVLETSDKMGEGMVNVILYSLLPWLEKQGATLVTGVKSLEITDQGVNIITRDGKKQTFTADSVIPALPLKSNTGWLKKLEGQVPKIYAIGDCLEPRLIVDAIADGMRTARDI
jgi:2,4-dienoyl-CoA reductase (NADPH2)